MENQREIKIYDIEDNYRDSIFITSSETLQELKDFGMIDSYNFNFEVGTIKEDLNKLSNLELLNNDLVLKEILKDSFGGVMYDLNNKNKYDTVELLKIWDSLENHEKLSVGGIIEGAINFIKNK